MLSSGDEYAKAVSPFMIPILSGDTMSFGGDDRDVTQPRSQRMPNNPQYGNNDRPHTISDSNGNSQREIDQLEGEVQ